MSYSLLPEKTLRGCGSITSGLRAVACQEPAQRHYESQGMALESYFSLELEKSLRLSSFMVESCGVSACKRRLNSCLTHLDASAQQVSVIGRAHGTTT